MAGSPPILEHLQKEILFVESAETVGRRKIWGNIVQQERFPGCQNLFHDIQLSQKITARNPQISFAYNESLNKKENVAIFHGMIFHVYISV